MRGLASIARLHCLRRTLQRREINAYSSQFTALVVIEKSREKFQKKRKICWQMICILRDKSLSAADETVTFLTTKSAETHIYGDFQCHMLKIMHQSEWLYHWYKCVMERLALGCGLKKV